MSSDPRLAYMVDGSRNSAMTRIFFLFFFMICLYYVLNTNVLLF